MGIIGTIIAGAIIGALARFFMKGEQNIGVLWTVILGAGGAALGSWFVEGIMHSDSNILRWIVSIILAIVLISIYLSVTRGGNRR